MGGHRRCEKSARDEHALRRVVIIKKNWQENM
jgi:hypothetical protein